jgi:MATE family multidrug resistance protein
MSQHPPSLFARARREAVVLVMLSLPMIITNVAYLGMRFVDTVFAGRLGSAELAGISVGGDLWVPVMLLAMGVLIAVSPTISHQFGAGDRDGVAHTARQGLWLGLMVGIPGALVLTQGGGIMRAIGVDPEVIPLADGYLKAIAWGFPSIALFYALRFVCEAVSFTRPLLLVAVVSFVVNAFADWVLMYGKLGFPQLGAIGTGYASAITQWVMFFVLLFYMRGAPVFRRLEIFRHFEWPNRKVIAQLALLGAPIAVSIFMEGSLFSAVGLLMATLGTVTVAAHQIAVNWSAMMFMVPLGLAGGITVRVGQALGAGQAEQARFRGVVGMVTAVAFMAFSSLIMVIFHDPIVALYTRESDVAALAVSLLFVAVAFQLFDGQQVAAAGVLRGYKDTRIPMFITVLAYWGLGFPTAWGIGIVLDGGPLWVWVGLISGLFTAGVLLTWRFMLVSKRNPHLAGTSAHGTRHTEHPADGRDDDRTQ